ncbi:hypothetical protein D3273_25280 [Lichenibacterium minor]|uniref:Uncharacterized protein n=1 Tax=Lichenibacterium minor TaxID=2316528 RepID=A0A4Q2TZJ0_9HYPH|nr:hypothetical protein [Lichenibacterium minor]RYC29180.1 hypothetical protein D3273_25280 [Lichenibacterium minor]
MSFKKADPIADAQAQVDKFTAQRDRLAERLAEADGRVGAAQRARHEALTGGDPTAAETAKFDKACADATEARGGVDEAARAVAQQLEEATRHCDVLRDATLRAGVADAEELRASALDAAAEALADAARAFDGARVALVAAVAQHGVRIENPLSTDGSTSAALLVRPVVQAALRLGAPGMFPTADGLGVALDTDPVLSLRRGQSGRLRDHAEDVRAGVIPAAELPRPGAPAQALNPDSPLAPEPRAIAVFSAPFSYLAKNSSSLVSVEAGQVEVPERVVSVAMEMGVAFAVGSADALAILGRIANTPAYGAKLARVFIDTDDGVVGSAPAARVASPPWPDDRSTGARA